MKRGWQAVTMTEERARGGRSTTPFLGLRMAWDDGGTMAASTAAHNNQIVNGGGGRGIGDGAQQSQNSEWERGGS